MATLDPFSSYHNQHYSDYNICNCYNDPGLTKTYHILMSTIFHPTYSTFFTMVDISDETGLTTNHNQLIYQHAWSYWQEDSGSDPVTVRHIVVADLEPNNLEPHHRFVEAEPRFVDVEPKNHFVQQRQINTTPSILTDKTALLYHDTRPFSYTKVTNRIWIDIIEELWNKIKL